MARGGGREMWRRMRRVPSKAYLVVLVGLLQTVVATAGPDSAALLERADAVKADDNAAFANLLDTLSAGRTAMSPEQRARLRFLEAWQLGRDGKFDAAEAALHEVLADAAADPVLRFRARVELASDETALGHHVAAYGELAHLLEALPANLDARYLRDAYALASTMYDAAGQDELAVEFADRWLRSASAGTPTCRGDYLRAAALAHAGKSPADDTALQAAIEGCARAGDRDAADALRVLLAEAQLRAQHPDEAIATLAGDGSVAARRPVVEAGYQALLARCLMAKDDLPGARTHAQAALDAGAPAEAAARVDALDVLWRIARTQGDFRTALVDHERFFDAERRHVDDTQARALAFQLVHQQLADRKREAVALGERNQLLLLQRQVIEKSAESERLYMLLLLLVIGFFALWTFRVRRSQLRFQKIARRDSLTGIVNRQHFMDAAKRELQACEKSGREAALILVDLDNFKRVNDTHGHIAGDGVLRQSVEMFQLHLRPEDLFGRLGGEEFAILMSDCTIETAFARAEELRSALAGFVHAGVELAVTASFGVASTRGSGSDLRRLMIDADAALYTAKRRGRNCVGMNDGTPA
jgi:diguanylate cyclase (GGDEF)-like protein